MNSERYESVTLNYIRKNEWFRDYSKMEQNDENKFIKVFPEKIPLFFYCPCRDLKFQFKLNSRVFWYADERIWRIVSRSYFGSYVYPSFSDNLGHHKKKIENYSLEVYPRQVIGISIVQSIILYNQALTGFLCIK